MSNKALLKVAIYIVIFSCSDPFETSLILLLRSNLCSLHNNANSTYGVTTTVINSGRKLLLLSTRVFTFADIYMVSTLTFDLFQASSPQDLRLFYEKNKNLSPK